LTVKTVIECREDGGDKEGTITAKFAVAGALFGLSRKSVKLTKGKAT
jgi:hypothetical protein